MIINNYRSKEISWLSFNDRLLQEAKRKEVPLYERIKFLGIYSNNMDEFFRVRVAILKRLCQIGKNAVFNNNNPNEVLEEIQSIVVKNGIKFNLIYNEIIRELANLNIFLLNETMLNEKQGDFVKSYFKKKIRGHLMPVIISKKRPLPDLDDDDIYFAVSLRDSSTDKLTYYLIKIPSASKRFVILPQLGNNKYVMLVDDVIRYGLKDMFYMFKFDEIKAYTFKITRDAELDINDDLSVSYVKKIARSLEQRKDAAPVRFVYDKEMPEDLLYILLHKLKYTRDDAIIQGGRYHNFKDFIDFPKFNDITLKYNEFLPLYHNELKNDCSYFSAISHKDILLHFPYHSFQHFIDYLREASIDPKVKEIKLTIYRVGKQSSVINALRNAARNGKKVTAVIELQARFDEKANITWANSLKTAGVKVVFGVSGLKVHAKICIVTRKERNKLMKYACIGTGNFNEDSAGVFADHLLFTKNYEIASEISSIFDFFDTNYKIPSFKHLLVAPFYLRKQIEEFIQQETENAKKGLPAKIYIKVNNLVDFDIIQMLYKAKDAGVDVFLNVRGMFALVSKYDKDKEPIESIGIIDRYLEHSRIFVFGNNDNHRIFISSADIMSRNLDRRIEVACPIYDKKLQDEIITMLDYQRRDNCSARILNNDLDNEIRETEEEEDFRAQNEFYHYLKHKLD